MEAFNEIVVSLGVLVIIVAVLGGLAVSIYKAIVGE